MSKSQEQLRLKWANRRSNILALEFLDAGMDTLDAAGCFLASAYGLMESKYGREKAIAYLMEVAFEFEKAPTPEGPAAE